MAHDREESTGVDDLLGRIDPDRSPENEATFIQVVARRKPEPFPRVFAKVYGPLEEIHRSIRADGVLAAAVWDNDVLDTYAHLPVGDGAEFATVGRHELCDLRLGRDRSISLRHALIGVSRAGRGEVRVRLLDLASGTGFRTEDDVPCEALSAEGAVFVRLAGYHLLLLPTGEVAPLPWGGNAEETWQAFPERVYLDRRIPLRAPGGSRPDRQRKEPSSRRQSVTQIVQPPRPLRGRASSAPRLGAAGIVLGRVELETSRGAESFAVHDADLDRGILVGRYSRCELGGNDPKLSRVHLVIVRDGDDLWAIDTASTNGTRLDREVIRQLRLGRQTELVLGDVLTLRWAKEAQAEA